MRKSLFSIFIAAATVLGLSACGASSSLQTQTATAVLSPANTVVSAAALTTADAGSRVFSGSKAASASSGDTSAELLIPEASGEIREGNAQASFDLSHTEDGYFMVSYLGTTDKAKVQVTMPATPEGGEEVYTYTLKHEGYKAFPLSGGSGRYKLAIYEHLQGNQYVLAYSLQTDVELADEFGPFLYPNQYAWYEAGDASVKLAQQLRGKSKDDLELVQKVYNYVISHISYDTEKAKNPPANYVPVPDDTLSSGKGICFDYASLMTVMLRCQNVPTRLVVGYSGTSYHAWISVYLSEIGWVDNIIQFDGKSWSLMDPTLAANNNSKFVQEYIGDGNHYTVKYIY